MVEKEFLMENDAGVHARPATLLVQLAMSYPCEVFLIKDGVESNAKSIMGVLSLAITYGSKITIKTDGDQEEEAAQKILELFNSNFEQK